MNFDKIYIPKRSRLKFPIGSIVVIARGANKDYGNFLGKKAKVISLILHSTNKHCGREILVEIFNKEKIRILKNVYEDDLDLDKINILK